MLFRSYAVGEAVFNTAMTGYQEILSDPSYARQLVTLTYPHIGNVGSNEEDDEAPRVDAAGLIIKALSPRASNWRSKLDLPAYLKQRGICAIAGIDTRKLTRILRTEGAQAACLLAGDEAGQGEEAALKALTKAREFPGMAGLDLAKEVTTHEAYLWREGSWTLNDGHQHAQTPARFRVVALDFGVKRNILRMLVDRACEVHVLPAQSTAKAILALKPDRVVLATHRVSGPLLDPHHRLVGRRLGRSLHDAHASGEMPDVVRSLGPPRGLRRLQRQQIGRAHV